MGDPTLVRRVVIRNYRSIASCDVRLGPLTFLVGPNGSGKSNFLDALHFVADALGSTLEAALVRRGGVREVRRRSKGHPTHFGVRLAFALPSGERGYYAFEIAGRGSYGFEVRAEECRVGVPNPLGSPTRYKVRAGQVHDWSLSSRPPAVSADRLYLVAASGFPEFGRVFEALKAMAFYNLNPDAIRALQRPDPAALLGREGANLASVMARIAAEQPTAKARIEDYLSRIVPGVRSVEHYQMGSLFTLEFRQDVRGSKHPWRFPAQSMSDGTLRALGVLVALLQARNGMGSAVRLVGIEEPEIALHPAALGVLLDCFREASRSVQVVVTSHSADLLDSDAIDDEAIVAVDSAAGRTVLGPSNPVSRDALRERLFTAGELLRMNQLLPERVDLGREKQLALRLFGEEPEE